jgi:hypothetical protein
MRFRHTWLSVASTGAMARAAIRRRQPPLLFHPRKQLSLWSLASIIKDKGAAAPPSSSSPRTICTLTVIRFLRSIVPHH